MKRKRKTLITKLGQGRRRGSGEIGEGLGVALRRWWLGAAQRATVARGGAAGLGTTARRLGEGTTAAALAGGARGRRRREAEHGNGVGVKIGIKSQEGRGAGQMRDALWQNQPELYRLKYASPLQRAPTCFKWYNPLACRVTSR
jgi:hypothetical protein